MLWNVDVVYENLMIDCDFVLFWVDGNVVLMGDVVYVMYLMGFNGVSQVIVDVCMIGVWMLDYGVNVIVFQVYND